MNNSFSTTPSNTRSGTPGSSRAANISRRLSAVLTPGNPTPKGTVKDSSSKENANNGEYKCRGGDYGCDNPTHNPPLSSFKVNRG